ncbi:unnamed protein product [Echinostoma caproni]|uniref:Exocyst complex component Sec10 n=1 Tax=Echinostoma caproni TaxID=27848 RepID=A0A183ABZ8_9TREM|nr:unnamed protein product [Echinostoma caproni]
MVKFLRGIAELAELLQPTLNPSQTAGCPDAATDASKELREFHQSYLRDRSQFRFYFEYMLASANDALVFADSIVKIVMQELAEDAQLKGRMTSHINTLKAQFEKVAEHCRLAAEETILLDLNFVLTNVMTPQCSPPLPGVEDACYKVIQYNDRCYIRVGAAYDCLPEIAQMFMERDPSMLYLDIAKFVKHFPDVRSDQLYTLLLSRGDLRSSDAKELAWNSLGTGDARTKTSPLNIFTKLSVAAQR